MMKKIKIEIENMHCANCIVNVVNALDSIPRVLDVKRVKIGRAVALVSNEIVLAEVYQAIEKDGIYKVKNIK